MILWLAILATILFVLSSWWLVRDAYRAVKGLDRPTALSIVTFITTGESMAILWLFVWSGK